MRLDSAGAEHRVVQRDVLNLALERIQRGTGAAVLRSQRLIILTGADEDCRQLARIGCDITR